MGCSLTNATEGGAGLASPAPEVRRRLSESTRKRMSSEAAKQIIVSSNKARTWTEEQRAEMSRRSAARMGTKEARQRVSEQFKGVPKSEEMKANLSRATRGKPQSPEHTRKVIETKIKKRIAPPLLGSPRTLSCVNGHFYSPQTTFVNCRGRRECRVCISARGRKRYEERNKQTS